MRYPITVAVVLVLFHFTWADRAYRSEDHALRKSSHWSSWSECSVSCGVGQRTRHCHHSCSHHSNSESEHCDMGKCPSLTQESYTRMNTALNAGGASISCLRPALTNTDMYDARYTIFASQGFTIRFSPFQPFLIGCGDFPPRPIKSSLLMSRKWHLICQGLEMKILDGKFLASDNGELCNKIDTIRSIAEPLELHSVFDKCDQSLNHALVYNFCNISLGPAVWHRGQKVTDFCSSMNRYTPIGTFPQDIFFRPSDSFTGILIGCFPNKTIQIAAQMCGHEPAIYTVPADHAKYHILPADADSLYTIVQ